MHATGLEPMLLMFIFSGYLGVAAFIVRAAWVAGFRTQRGISRMFFAAVFALCAYAGYGSEYLGHDMWGDVAHYILATALIGLLVCFALGVNVFGD